MIEIARLHEEVAATMIYVTHDQVQAMTMADKIVVLRAGVVEQVGTALEFYQHPNNLFIVQAHGDNPARVHDKVVIGVEGRTCHLFGPDGLAVPRVERHPLADIGKDRAMLAS